jgi:hypothetical protein
MEQDNIDRVNKEAFEILGLEKAPDNFTAQLMDKIQGETLQAVRKDNPIIGKWGWFVILLFFVVLLAGASFSAAALNQGNGLLSGSFLSEWSVRYIKPVLASVINGGGQLGLVVLIGMAATFLLFADRLIGNKLNNRTSYS